MFSIMLLLQDGQLLSARQVGEKLGVSPRNARAYINALQNEGVPIYSISGRGGGYYLDKSYVFKPPPLKDEELTALSLLVEALKTNDDFGYRQESLMGLTRILTAHSADASATFLSNQLDAANLNRVQMTLTAIHKAIKQQKKLRIYYKDVNRKGSERIICPYQVVYKEQAWYLFAYCEFRQETRLFKVLRIKEIETLDEKYVMYDDQCFDREMQTTFSLVKGEQEYNVVIHFVHPASQWVRERKWIDNQHIEVLEDNSIMYSCRVSGLVDIRRWVLGYGAFAKVIEPLELVASVQGELRTMLAYYE